MINRMEFSECSFTVGPNYLAKIMLTTLGNAAAMAILFSMYYVLLFEGISSDFTQTRNGTCF